MVASLTLTVIGQDRPGLVMALSERIAAAGGNWLESRMARLAGQFAGILLAEVPEAQVAGLIASLQELERHGLFVRVEHGLGEEATEARRLLELDLIGQDRPGIVREVAQTLAERRINIEELTTTVVSGSFSGERLFQVVARLQVPSDVENEQLREALEALANELMVDIELEESQG